MPKPIFIVGIDLGTTNWKAGLYTPQGTCRAFVTLPAPLKRNREGLYYHPDGCWRTFCRLTRLLLQSARVSPSRIAGLAVSSQAETGMPLDRTGRWLYPAIPWHDDRTLPQWRWLVQHVGADPIFTTTGLTLRHIFTLPKWLWLRQHHPGVLRRMAKWAWLPDFITWNMTGVLATEYSIASRSMVFDIRKKRWDSSLAILAGLTPAQLPEPVPAGITVGSVSREASRDTGLPQGLPVVTGGHDHLCGAFAAGATRPGILLDSIGTAESLVATLSRPLARHRKGYSTGCHVVPDRYYVMGGLYSSSAVVEWLLKKFAPGRTYDWLIRESARAPVGPTGLLFLPHLWGSSSIQADPTSRAALVGLTGQHGRSQVIKAIFEGLSFEAAEMMRDIEQLTRTRTKELRVIGAVSGNQAWMAIKSHVTGLPLRIMAVDGAAQGAAMLAGLGAQVYRDEEDLRSRVRIATTRVNPTPAMTRAYGKFRPAYIRLYSAVKSLDA